MAEFPKIAIGGHPVSRLIIGGNPFSGNSHISDDLDREMRDYYTVENIKRALFLAEEVGITAFQARGDEMASVIRQVAKPCLALKILAAGRRVGSQDEVRRSFDYVFSNLKPSDGCIVGVFQKYKDQVSENAVLVKEICGS